MGPKVKQRGKNCLDRATMANILFALATLTMCLKPVTAPYKVIQIDPAASPTMLAMDRT